MHQKFLSQLTPKLAAFALFSALFAAICGCSHPREEGAEQMGSAIPSLFAKQTFFDGKVVVEANLGRGFRYGGGPGGSPGGGGHHGHHGFGGPGGPGGGGPGGGGPGGPGGDAEERGPMMQETSMPPVALRIRLTNTSKETLEVTFLLCKSELGDFAVRPEKIALAPDQTAEPDPMTSQLGLTTTELALQVGLRSNGKSEEKTLTLQPVGHSGE